MNDIDTDCLINKKYLLNSVSKYSINEKSSVDTDHTTYIKCTPNKQ